MTKSNGNSRRLLSHWLPTRLTALKIAGVYALFGGLWILARNWLMDHYIHRASVANFLQPLKGSLIIVTTGLLLGLLLDYYFRQIRRSAKLLEENERKLRLLSDNLPDSYLFQYVPGENGKPQFTYASAGVERVHGITVAEVLRDSDCLRMQVAPEIRSALADAEAQSAKNLSDFEMEVRIQNPNGTSRILSLRSHPHQDASGHIIWDGIATDITAHRQAHQALQQSEQNYREIFNAGNEAIVLHDAATGQVLDVNDAMVRMYGFQSKAEVLSKQTRDLVAGVPPYDWETVCRKIKLAIDEGPQVFEWLARKKDGRDFWVEVSLRSSTIGGQGRVLAVLRDITLRKAHEREIERLNRLYETLSDVNQSIVRSKSRQELFEAICRVAVKSRHFQIASVSWLQPDGSLECLARELDCPGAESLPLRTGCAISAGAIRTGCASFSNEICQDERLAACSLQALQFNLHSCAAVPFRFQDRVQGVLEIVSHEQDFFNAEEIRLLEEVTSDISYALDRLHEQDLRRQAEQSLRESEERFGKAFQSSPVGLAITRASDGKIVEMNDMLAVITGYSREETVGRTSVELGLLSPEMREKFAEQMRQHGRIGLSDMVLQNKTGGLRQVLVSADSIMLQGHPHFIASFNDITESRRTEDTLRRQGAALEAAANAVVITNRNGQIEWVNPAFTTTTGYTVDEVLGQNPRLLKSGEHDKAFYKNLWSTIIQGNIWHGELINRRKDGSLYHEHMTVTPLRDNLGAITHFIAIKQDITEKKRLEAQYQQAQKMESVGQLAGGVAHDFNNLLTVIQGNISLLRMRGALSEDHASSITEIARAADRAANLTRQLLLFSRKQVMQMRQLDLNEAVTSMAKMLQRIIGEDVRLQLHLHSTPLLIKADAGMLDQVLMNLTVNARDAMPGGGKLTIETSEMTVDKVPAQFPPETAPGRYACLRVVDNGAGIPPTVLPHIFEPFFTTKEPGKGTGLGLATVFGIVKQHHGWLTVDSQCGQGASFQIYFPAGDAGAAEETKIVPSKPRGGTETILLVEDDPAVRQIILIILERHGYNILEARNGTEAFRLWDDHASGVDLLLTDLVMPAGIRGQELARKLQADKPGLKVIFITGYSPEIAGREFKLQPGENFLQKPFLPEELLKIIRNSFES